MDEALASDNTKGNTGGEVASPAALEKEKVGRKKVKKEKKANETDDNDSEGEDHGKKGKRTKKANKKQESEDKTERKKKQSSAKKKEKAEGTEKVERKRKREPAKKEDDAVEEGDEDKKKRKKTTAAKGERAKPRKANLVTINPKNQAIMDAIEEIGSYEFKLAAGGRSFPVCHIPSLYNHLQLYTHSHPKSSGQSSALMMCDLSTVS